MQLIVLTTLTMIAFAANSILNRMAVDGAGMAPMAFAAVRLVSGAAVLVLLTRAPLVFKGRRRGIGVLALLAYAVGFSLAYGALDAGLGALILFGMVQITMFAAAVAAKEQMPVQRWVGGLLAFGGLVWLLSPGEGAVPLWPAASMAIAGVAWGFYSLAGKAEPDAVAGTAANFLLAAPLGVLAWAVIGGGLTPMGTVLAVISGAVTSGMGYALWYRLVPQLGASRAAVAQLTVPVIAAGMGALLLAEVPSLRLILSGALVLGGVVLSLSSGWARAGRS